MIPAGTFNQSTRRRLILLLIFSFAVVLLAVSMPPTSQPQAYHQFADQRLLFGIPNFMNVISNLAILLSGSAGLLFLWRSYRRLNECQQQCFLTTAEYFPYLLVFVSAVMVVPGSAYYHWEPDNASLLWDRLPIALGVTALLAAVLSERIHPKLGTGFLPILALMGMASVIYWYLGELRGIGNLNFYIVIQFYSLLLIVLLSILLPSRYTHGNEIIRVIGFYALAKLAETFDHEIYNLIGIVSGHTVKHLLAAWAIWLIVRMLQRRVPVSAKQ
ncbi:hypothetical protein SAMN05216326_10958 [Nitrosomonas marina]|uniref:Ceramidase n=2 Tax=Nitrosomonas marina TaxID=917 RepID=A0A1I0B4X3_9PROT|nr:hypothetical protein SAMN05216326_10958 [Nitrosomonas marina]